MAAAWLLGLLAAVPAAAQVAHDPPSLIRRPIVQEAIELVARLEPQTIEDQIAICEIPAPPYLESERAEDYRRRLQELGLQNVRIDREGNVIGERPGRDPDGPLVVVSGHLDTVFPEGTDVTVTRDGPILRGPGIADDCRGLAVLIAIARALDGAGIETLGTLVFVGTVGEEGPGNLRGVRYLLQEELRDQVDFFLSIDGAGLNTAKDAVGSYRYTVTYRGPGGHSYGSFGMPNPVHALGRAIAAIGDLEVPSDPRVTFSVGVIDGGTSVNAIAQQASMEVDLRSVDPDRLDALEQRFLEVVEEARLAEQQRWGESTVPLNVEVDRWGVRPAGEQLLSDRIVLTAQSAARALGFVTPIGAGSTDANIAISLGIPALTLGGGGVSGGVHSLDEWFDGTASEFGAQWVFLLTLALAGTR